jgi:hypothetical protein
MKKEKKRGQLMGQPLLMIFAAIAGIMLLLFGFVLVTRLKETGDSVEIANFVGKIQKEVNRYYYLDVGSRAKLDVNLPETVDFICFSRKGHGIGEIITAIDPSLAEFVNTDKNVFFIPLSAYSNTAFAVKNLNIADNSMNPLCIGNGGSFFLETEAGYVRAGMGFSDRLCNVLKSESVYPNNYCDILSGWGYEHGCPDCS